MSVKDRPRLGRGLKSLISHPVTISPEAAASAGSVDRLRDIDLSLIDPNPHQPRSAIDLPTLRELAASIRHSGILQPVILRPIPDGRYQLVAGHRRTEAAKLAGLERIPALLRTDSTEEQQAEWALIENIQRQDLNPIERAKAYRTYIDKFNITHTQAAERLGEDRATLSNFLRLLELNSGIQELISRNLLSLGHAKILAGVTDPGLQNALANRVVSEGCSVRRLEELATETANALQNLDATETTTTVSAHPRTLIAKSPHVVELEQDLSRKLGTKLRIFPSKKKNTGKIVIQYYSLDEFDRLAEKFS